MDGVDFSQTSWWTPIYCRRSSCERQAIRARSEQAWASLSNNAQPLSDFSIYRVASGVLFQQERREERRFSLLLLRKPRIKRGKMEVSEKIIIDTDPGIDDSMAILMAFQMPNLEILGLTTIFGNVRTEDATRNALLLCEIAGHPNISVAEGSHEPLKGGKPRVADFVHGSDGLGNIFLPSPKGKKIGKSASEFLVDKVLEYPGVVSILALGPLTNLALAIKRDSSFASKVKRIVILGGAFFASGNVNPAAEANIYGDPEAADVVFTSGADIVVVGINITTQVTLTDEALAELKASNGRYAQFISNMCQFYRDWHVKSDGVYGIFLHDPVSFTALVRPDLFTFKKGVVRVETQGICLGHTLMDQGLKRWNVSNPWSDYSPVSVAWTVDIQGVLAFIKNLLMKQ
ncbi:probable uridine nucleosidase 1 isoform X1 [Magnolia sinica]|uniref:probable uridine nucleosidase 1 isoform X1 n=1 Tax=Magnolia sinica TaxID=86752 RepID=UPI0026584126|nr:probable uridine nucleosidase 1 isoform X1 [Magnolia sinica]